MLNDEAIEKITERLVNRIEQGNNYILKEIGKSIKDLGTLSASDAKKLQQILQYGGDFNKIVNKLAEITKLNIEDIYKIFDEVAKIDYNFAKQFYDYRGVKYIPYKENKILQNHIKSLAKIASQDYVNLTKTSSIGFAIKNEKGNVAFVGLKNMYQTLLDNAVVNITEGKSTIDEEIRKTIRQIDDSGIRVMFESGRTMRLDSAVRMQIGSAVTNLSMEMQKTFGEEFDADGVEITVHENPAPDHEKVQGKQFSLEEFNNFQNDKDAVSYDGVKFPRISEETKRDRRSIGQYNCYHTFFSIILGVSQPLYTNEQLQKIIDDNKKGFEFEGKHYTNYEGTQLQRNIETEIRKEKENQMLALASGKEGLAQESQMNIDNLVKKYYDLSKASGLPTKLERINVEGYREIKVIKKPAEIDIGKQKSNILSIPINENNDFEKQFNTYSKKLEQKNVVISPSVYNLDKDLVLTNLEQLDKLSDKYIDIGNMNKERLAINANYLGENIYGNASYDLREINLSSKFYKDKEKLINAAKRDQNINWHYKVNENDLDKYTITHEFGHIIEYNYIQHQRKLSDAYLGYKEIDTNLKDMLINKAMKETGKMAKTEFKKKYFSGYANKRRNYEWFAELFTQAELGIEETPLTKVFKEWLEEFINEIK